MLKQVFLAVLFAASANVALAHDLASEIDLVVAAGHAAASESEAATGIEFAESENAFPAAVSYSVYTPPLLDASVQFLAYAPEENPYPNPISYANAAPLIERANTACRLLGDNNATRIAMEQHFAPTELAATYSGVALVDVFSPMQLYRPGHGLVTVPPSSISSLTCTRF